MKNYIIEWFPERKIKNHYICFKNSKRLFFIGLFVTVISLLIGLLPFFGVGAITIGTWFNISVNVFLMMYYGWLLFTIKKNDIGNGVPEKW